MALLSRLLSSTADNGLRFFCPGCKTPHRIQHGTGPGPRWGWNGDADKPTFTPSVLVTGRDLTPKGEADFEAWCAAGHPDRKGVPFESADVRCHTFVTDGRIQYLSDCTHHLAGQTIDLPPWPTDEWGP